MPVLAARWRPPPVNLMHQSPPAQGCIVPQEPAPLPCRPAGLLSTQGAFVVNYPFDGTASGWDAYNATQVSPCWRHAWRRCLLASSAAEDREGQAGVLRAWAEHPRRAPHAAQAGGGACFTPACMLPCR